MFFKQPHVSIFSGRTRCGKTHKVLDLLETEYKGVFYYIVIICRTLRWNKTYDRPWIEEDPCVYLVDPENAFLEIFTYLSEATAGENILYIIDDLISDESMGKQRGSLINTTVSGRHKGHSIWLLTQKYKRIPNTIRDQAEQLFIWYPKGRNELELIHEENEVLDKSDIEVVREILKTRKYSCLFLRAEPPVQWQILTKKQ